jgi:hypothetical protein
LLHCAHDVPHACSYSLKNLELDFDVGARPGVRI